MHDLVARETPFAWQNRFSDDGKSPKVGAEIAGKGPDRDPHRPKVDESQTDSA